MITKKILTSALTIALLFPAAGFSRAEDEVEQRYLGLRREEIEAKQSKMTDFSRRIEVIQKQLEDERKSMLDSQERIWNEYTQSLELERRKLTDQMGTLEERQRLFEGELDKKREQDALRLREKEDEVRRMMYEVDRLKIELEQDKKVFENQSAAAARSAETTTSRSSEVTLENNSIRIAQMPARDVLGNAPFAPRKVRAEYYVEIGDILDVDVWRVPDLSRSLSVRPDGRISMPIVGDLDVVGLSLVEVRDLLTQKFSEYVWNPQVSISIRQFGGRKFVILGEIGAPGVYRYQQDISLIEAIALAGGFRDNSRRGKIMVIRGDIRKEPQVKIINANMENVLKRGMLSENIMVLPNDIIYIGKDLIGDYKEVLDNVVSPFFDTAIDYFVLHAASRADHNS